MILKISFHARFHFVRQITHKYRYRFFLIQPTNRNALLPQSYSRLDHFQNEGLRIATGD